MHPSVNQLFEPIAYQWCYSRAWSYSKCIIVRMSPSWQPTGPHRISTACRLQFKLFKFKQKHWLKGLGLVSLTCFFLMILYIFLEFWFVYCNSKQTNHMSNVWCHSSCHSTICWMQFLCDLLEKYEWAHFTTSSQSWRCWNQSPALQSMFSETSL